MTAVDPSSTDQLLHLGRVLCRLITVTSFVMAILRLRGSNGRAIKVEFVAAFADDVPVELDRTFTFGVSNKTPEFQKLNPRGKVCFPRWRHHLVKSFVHPRGRLSSTRRSLPSS